MKRRPRPSHILPLLGALALVACADDEQQATTPQAVVTFSTGGAVEPGWGFELSVTLEGCEPPGVRVFFDELQPQNLIGQSDDGELFVTIAHLVAPGLFELLVFIDSCGGARLSEPLELRVPIDIADHCRVAHSLPGVIDVVEMTTANPEPGERVEIAATAVGGPPCDIIAADVPIVFEVLIGDATFERSGEASVETVTDAQGVAEAVLVVGDEAQGEIRVMVRYRDAMLGGSAELALCADCD